MVVLPHRLTPIMSFMWGVARLLIMSSVMSLLIPVREGGIFCAHHGFHERMDWSSMICLFCQVSLYMFRRSSRISGDFVRWSSRVFDVFVRLLNLICDIKSFRNKIFKYYIINIYDLSFLCSIVNSFFIKFNRSFPIINGIKIPGLFL